MTEYNPTKSFIIIKNNHWLYLLLGSLWWITLCCPLTCRLSLSMLTTILVSSHCTLRPTLRTPCCSSGPSFSHIRLSKEEGSGEKGRPSEMGGGKGKGKLERREAVPAPGWGLESCMMERSGGNMLSRGSTTSGSHAKLQPCEVDFTGKKTAQDNGYKTILTITVKTVKGTICSGMLCSFLQFTWLSKSDTEVVSHRSAGVGSDWTVAMIPCPLDQSLWPWWQLLLGGFWHLH